MFKKTCNSVNFDTNGTQHQIPIETRYHSIFRLHCNDVWVLIWHNESQRWGRTSSGVKLEICNNYNSHVHHGLFVGVAFSKSTSQWTSLSKQIKGQLRNTTLPSGLCNKDEHWCRLHEHHGITLLIQQESREHLHLAVMDSPPTWNIETMYMLSSLSNFPTNLYCMKSLKVHLHVVCFSQVN